MPKLEAKSVKIYSSDADTTLPFGDFNEANYTKDPDALQTAVYSEGWNDTTTQPNKTPTAEHFNTLQYLNTRELAYIKEVGLVEWVTGTTYYEHSVVRKLGTYELYGSKVNDNTATLPDRVDDASWKFIIDLSSSGGLPKDFINDTIFYGGFSEYYDYIGRPEYNESDESYTLDGSTQYMATKDIKVGGVDEFVIVTKFNTNNLTNQKAIYGSNVDGVVGIQIDIDGDGTDRLQLWASSNGSTTDIASGVLGTTTISLNTDYFLRTTKTPTNYIVELSADGIVWNTEINIASSSQIFAGFDIIFGARTPTTNKLSGKLWLSETYITVNNVEILPKETTPYLLNSIVWKGEIRSDDNSKDIISSDYIGSEPIFNANNQYLETGTPTYDYENYTYELDGSTDFISKSDVTGFNASDFDYNIKFNANSVTSCPLGAVGQGSGNLGFSMKILNGIMNLWLSSNGTSWDIVSGTTGSVVYNTLTDYIVRLHRDASNWYVDYSIDNGVNWVNDITVNSSADMFNQTYYFNVAGDGTTSPDITMNGTVYLEKTSLFLNGKYIIKSQDPVTATIPYTNYYYFIGYDNSETLRLERTVNKDGSGLPTITGAKRRLGDDKDVEFPTDGNGDLAYFERNFENWEFELWVGIINSNANAILSTDISNFIKLEYIFALDSNANSNYEIRPNTMKNFISNIENYLYITKSNAGTTRHTRCAYTAERTLRFTDFSNMTLNKIKGIK